MSDHIAELATNIRRNLKHMAQTVNDRDTPYSGELLDYINHMDTIAQQIETDAQKAQPPCGADVAVPALAILIDSALDHYTPHMVAIPSAKWSEAMALLASQPAAPVATATVAVPDGFVLVPKRPTVDMLTAMMDAYGSGTGSCGEATGHDMSDAIDAYAALLAASAQPSKKEGE